MSIFATKTALTLAIAFLTVFSGGQQRQRRIGPAESAGRVFLESPRIELPMDVDSRRPMIEMTVNGEGPYWFIVDTGAGTSVIDAGLAEEIGLTANGIQHVRSPNGPTIESPQYGVEALVSGGLRIEGAPMVGIDLASMAGDLFQGVLGIGVFTDHLVTLDYAESRLVVESGSLSPGAPGTVSFTGAGRAMGVEIDVAGVPLLAHLDTGSPGGFMLPKALEARWTFAAPPADGPPAQLVGAEHPTWRARLDGTVTVAGITFADPEIGLAEFTSDFANIGYEIFRDLAVTIDQDSRLVRFVRGGSAAEPGNGPTAAPSAGGAQPQRLGIAFAMTPGGLQIADGGVAVRLVEDDGAAAAAGIRSGDVLTSINGEAVPDMDVARFSELMRNIRPLQLTLVRDGGSFETRIDR